MTLSHRSMAHMQFRSHDDSSSIKQSTLSLTMSISEANNDDKKVGVTRLIREKLNFQDERLWKRFSARRLELIDAMDLSSKKASEQEDEIRKCAEILRIEFLYNPLYYSDFDKLVRAAVQSVRRNRKRGSKTSRSGGKRQRLDQPINEGEPMKSESPPGIKLSSEPNSFISEIAHLNTDSNGSVYDMSYSTLRVITHKDQSRDVVDSIIKPVKPLGNQQAVKPSLPPLLKLQTTQQQAENQQKLRATQISLLQLIRRSKSCSIVALRPNNDHLCELGRSAFHAVNALMFETSFQNLNQTSVDYLKTRVTQRDFLSEFFRGLDQESSSLSLDEETAVTTLQILIGCCIIDFGFDSVVYLVAEAIYYLILIEYPLVLKSTTQFNPRTFQHRDNESQRNASSFPGGNPLTNLATVATEFQSFKSGYNPNSTQDITKDNTTLRPHSGFVSEERKSVTLRFLSNSFKFSYPIKSSAPPRYVELMDNAKQAFKLNENQLYGLKNTKTQTIILSDLELEKVFYNETLVDLEIYSQGFLAIPIYELTSTVTPSDEKAKFILPPPIKLASPPAVATSIKRPISVCRNSNKPNFQPLL